MSINTASCLFVRLIPFLVIVDIINGYFLNKGMDSSLGVCVKAVILLLSISILMVSTKFRLYIHLCTFFSFDCTFKHRFANSSDYQSFTEICNGSVCILCGCFLVSYK